MFEKVQDVIVEELGVDASSVTPEASIIDDLDADSLDVVELIMTLEETFDIKIEDDKVQSLRTVKDVVEFINTKQ